MSREDRRTVLVLLLMTAIVIAFLVSTKQIKGGIQGYITNIDKIIHSKVKAASNDDIEKANGTQEDNDIKEEQFEQEDEFSEDNDIKEEQMKNNVKAD